MSKMGGYYVKVLMDDFDVIELKDLNPDQVHFIDFKGKRYDEVRHGKWIYKGNRGRFPACECSVCGNVENADWVILGDNVNYCPNCGSRMDLEDEKEDG